jgi:AraC-like DNA-binding protein
MPRPSVKSLLFARANLELPLPTSSPQLAGLHDRFSGECIEQLDNARTSYRVRELIIRRLPDGEPKREKIAKALCMTERSLQRRFQQEGTSFLQVMDDTRRELA